MMYYLYELSVRPTSENVIPATSEYGIDERK